MSVGPQFSLAFLCREVFWVALGFGFLTVLIHARMRPDVQMLVIPLVGASWGAATGGLFSKTLEGSKAGLLAGFALLLLMLGMSSTR